MTNVCHAVSRLEKTLESILAPGGPCLWPLGCVLADSRVTLPHGEGRELTGLLDEVGRPKGQNGENLETSGLGRGPPEDVIYHDDQTKV